jgi:hypothetical protein
MNLGLVTGPLAQAFTGLQAGQEEKRAREQREALLRYKLARDEEQNQFQRGLAQRQQQQHELQQALQNRLQGFVTGPKPVDPLTRTDGGGGKERAFSDQDILTAMEKPEDPNGFQSAVPLPKVNPQDMYQAKLAEGDEEVAPGVRYNFDRSVEARRLRAQEERERLRLEAAASRVKESPGQFKPVQMQDGTWTTIDETTGLDPQGNPVKGTVPREPSQGMPYQFFPQGVDEEGNPIFVAGNRQTGQVSPTEQRVLPRAQGGPGGAKMSAKLQNAHTNNKALLGEIDAAIGLAQKRPESFGLLRGIPVVGDDVNQRVDKEGIPARGRVANIRSLKMHDRFGGAVTVGEKEILKAWIPGERDDANAVIEKLRLMRDYVLQEQAAIEGGQVQRPQRDANTSEKADPRVETLKAQRAAAFKRGRLSPEAIEKIYQDGLKAIGIQE